MSERTDLLQLEDTFLSKNIQFNELFLILIIVSFSYFLGVILRLLRTKRVDILSAWFMRLWSLNKSELLTDKFPFHEWMINRFSDKNYYPEDVVKFFQQFNIDLAFAHFFNPLGFFMPPH